MCNLLIVRPWDNGPVTGDTFRHEWGKFMSDEQRELHNPVGFGTVRWMCVGGHGQIKSIIIYTQIFDLLNT